jgi:hypothetical protein
MLHTLGRKATDKERQLGLEFVAQTHASPEEVRWEMLAHNLLICNEFFYIR